ncbi:hypothetical protein [Paenibacillus sacheonensis]|uniref:Uncharacterized protein n=1 Tax=Paenibacillus sacheonensis TaxID=742054 RepID=A0A7X4YV23_9BACL|nr:hypothetical protein [Paenibacillus sacheonensis]MBM7566559.1 hypothetical protein [Paenibacillus sacheonensis]NBC73060.1 hypothetical protein [Paenibacillus sacheonensis]
MTFGMTLLEIFVALVCLAVLFGVWVNSDDPALTGLAILTALLTFNAILLAQALGSEGAYLFFRLSLSAARVWLSLNLTGALIAFTAYIFVKQADR